MADQAKDQGPDLGAGVPTADVPASGLLAGMVGGEAVVLVRGASGFTAIGAKCTHLGAPMAKGVVVGDTVRCPWHHACFDATSGEAVAAPAFIPLPCWTVEERDGHVFVRGRRGVASRPPRAAAGERIVIVGAGAAGYATADALLRLGVEAADITVVGSDTEAPYDRTLLTKDFLDGKFGEAELSIEGEDLGSRGIAVRLGVTVLAIERDTRTVTLSNGSALPYTKLVLATGAEPKRLTVPGAELPHVLTLRSAADCRAVLAQAAEAKRIVIVGGSFIGMETAASLRSRDYAVDVVSPDPHPFAKTFGPDLSAAILDSHRSKGVGLHLGRQVVRIEPDRVDLDDGSRLDADLVIVGIGVSPRTALAERAGLAVDNGIVVDAFLRTSDPDIFAVGDIARWPDPHSGGDIRVEHWDVATRQGQVAALNIVGHERRYDVVPFFWTKHFAFSVRYLGHATEWDEAALDGDLPGKDATVRFRKGGRDLAFATVGRDRAALDAELAMERAHGGTAVSLA